jgi:hypothetical protein
MPRKLKLSMQVLGALTVLICSYFGTLFILGEPDAPVSFLSIDGTDWCVDRVGSSKGGPAKITLSENKIVFFNEANTSANGHFEDSNTVVADDWGGLRGTLNAEKSVLTWANNTTWQRRPKCNS